MHRARAHFYWRGLSLARDFVQVRQVAEGEVFTVLLENPRENQFISLSYLS